MEPSKDYVFNHKGVYFATKGATPEYIDTLETFEIRDSDVFIVTFPKSGTVWTQNILSLIIHEGHRNGTENIENMDRMPWLEYNVKNMDYTSLPSPRVFATHLPYYLTPRDLRNKRARDLRSAVLKICDFLGRKLSEKEVESVVRQATFENMKKDPRANYEKMPGYLKDAKKVNFLRKGTIGDWKNIMTVAQSERVDEVLKKKMENLPIKFIWDINDQM
ncbi:PREDICTED: amine sulfotransferase-like [Tinamus guttatus]|uniref:amine sulfotransferase-like n=1 Tax=Tinamus guttatus TaxID=94827 RepID=UPI00052EBD09|nr:PREDICTED: amine sulfotransferase-like [Tinamus guttatus]